MTEEAKAARNAYRREWARSNPDKVRAYQSRYWAKKAESDRKKAEESETVKAVNRNADT